MLGPLHRPPYGIPLTVQEYAHGGRTGIACDEELVLSGYNHNVRIRLELENRCVDLRKWKNLSERGVREVYDTVRVGGWYRGAQVSREQSVMRRSGWKGYLLLLDETQDWVTVAQRTFVAVKRDPKR